MSTEAIKNAILNLRCWLDRGEAPALNQVRDTLEILENAIADHSDDLPLGEERDQIIADAKALYESHDGDIEIDSNARTRVTKVDGGYWVQAWTWIYQEEASND